MLLEGGADRSIGYMGPFMGDDGKTALDFAGSREVAVLLGASEEALGRFRFSEEPPAHSPPAYSPPAPAEADHARAMHYYSINGVNGEKDMYDDADNAAIVAALQAGHRSVQLAPKPYGRFEVRFGANGNTDWGRLPKAPESGMVQVNLGNQNTRIVGLISEGVPPPAQKWRRHFVGDREFWRWMGTNPATGQWYSKAEKDASIRFDEPSAGVVVQARDESTPLANRAWFDAQFDRAVDCI